MTRWMTTAFVAGLVFMLAAPSFAQRFRATLSGDNEVPVAVETDARGRATVRVEDDELVYRLRVRNGTNTLGAAGAHIHCAPEGENGPVVLFLAGVVPGGLEGRLEIRGVLTEQNILDPACGTTIEEIVDSMLAGGAYVNVHSLNFPPGEVRGQLEAR